MTCFLIDDHADDREIFLMALKALNPSIGLEMAENGVKALEKIKSDEHFLPDYIFLDMNMPYMSGKDCLIALREIERLKNVPILIYSSIQDFEELKSFGASRFIRKQNSIAETTKILSDIIK